MQNYLSSTSQHFELFAGPIRLLFQAAEATPADAAGASTPAGNAKRTLKLDFSRVATPMDHPVLVGLEVALRSEVNNFE